MVRDSNEGRTEKHVAFDYLSDSVGPSECHLIRLLRRMRLRNKFLSPTCAPGLGDVDTYFFFEKIFRSEIRICVTVT